MSIYTYLEKVALESMPRHRMAEAAVPYKQRKKEFKSFVQSRAKSKKPGKYEYVPGMATVGGVAGGLVGLVAGSGSRVGMGGGAAIGSLMGAGLGAITGLGTAANESAAIDQARKVVKGGHYDKALQDEIVAYRRHKEMQRQNERDWDRFERRLEHDETRRRLKRIEGNQLRRF